MVAATKPDTPPESGVLMVLVLGEALSWRHFAAFGCIMAAVGFLFLGR